MDGEAARESIEVSLACNRSALTAVQQERQRALYRLQGADVEEVRELADGYTFRHSPDKSVLLAIAEFVANERLCYPSFEFRITVERDGGPVWFRITGEGEAKRVLEPVLLASSAAVFAASWASSEPSVAKSILVGKMLISRRYPLSPVVWEIVSQLTFARMPCGGSERGGNGRLTGREMITLPPQSNLHYPLKIQNAQSSFSRALLGTDGTREVCFGRVVLR